MTGILDFLPYVGRVTNIYQQADAARVLQDINPDLYEGGYGPGTTAFNTAGMLLSMTPENAAAFIERGLVAPVHERPMLADIREGPLDNRFGDGIGPSPLLLIGLGVAAWAMSRRR